MHSWREYVLQHFKDPVPSITLVSDPNGLLLDEPILSELAKSHIDLITYEDPIQFRYIYENKYRDEVLSQTSEIKLVARTTEQDLLSLPFDLLQIGRQLHLRIEDIFPRLASSIVRQLPNHALDLLYDVYDQYHGSSSEQGTYEFLLKRVYKIPYDTIDTETDLIRNLLIYRYSNTILPTVIKDNLISQLLKRTQLFQLKLENLINSSSDFYDYLQEQWSFFLEDLSSRFNHLQVKEENINTRTDKNQVREKHFFEDLTIIPLLDNLFSEGKLKALSGFSANSLPEWTHVGIIIDPIADERYKINTLVKSIKEELQHSNSYRDWIRVMQKYAELKNICLSITLPSDDTLYEDVKLIEHEMDSCFESWLVQHYRSLASLPYIPYPVMVHQIPHSVSHKLQNRKIALLVVDGMSYVQWIQSRDAIRRDCSNVCFEENGVFAWIPTVTSISRQAIFTGEIPFYFGKTLDTTSKEEAAWKLFWESHGVPKSYVGYVKGLGKEAYKRPEILNNPKLRVAGIVVDTIDKLMHGSIQGQQGMYEEIKLWHRKGFLANLINDLLNLNFEVYITSDHGNKESYGIGRISEGVLANTKGERMRIYRERILRDEASVKYGEIAWDGAGLPDNVHVLLAKEDHAFVTRGDTIVGHGSYSPEEVIVPFIKVMRD
jgi:hypothetical protein